LECNLLHSAITIRDSVSSRSEPLPMAAGGGRAVHTPTGADGPTQKPAAGAGADHGPTGPVGEFRALGGHPPPRVPLHHSGVNRVGRPRSPRRTQSSARTLPAQGDDVRAGVSRIRSEV